MGNKRLRVEALLAAQASPLPPPAADLVPDPTLADDLFPEDLPRPLDLLVHADLYLQDEVEVALHPTLTRVWSCAGQAGQRLVQVPGKNFKRCGFGLVDWRDGYLDWALADGRRAVGQTPTPSAAAPAPGRRHTFAPRDEGPRRMVRNSRDRRLRLGQCTMQADQDTLTLRAQASDAESLRRVQQLVTGHLDRCSRCDRLSVKWQPPRAVSP